MTKKLAVSVIIPTKNSAKTVEKCLISILNQTYPSIEIMIIDNFSSDRTVLIVEKYGVKIIHKDTKRAESRNIGVMEASGNVVLAIDSDMELDSQVVTECVEKITMGYDAVIIPEISVGRGFWAKCKALEKICYLEDNLIEAARCFTKDSFMHVGGYDNELDAGEDWDLNNRIRRSGYKIGRIKSFVHHIEGELKLKETILKKYYYGKTIKRYKIKNPKEASQQLVIIRPAFILNWKKLAGDPIHTIGMLMMKACEFTSMIIGYILDSY